MDEADASSNTELPILEADVSKTSHRLNEEHADSKDKEASHIEYSSETCDSVITDSGTKDQENLTPEISDSGMQTGDVPLCDEICGFVIADSVTKGRENLTPEVSDSGLIMQTGDVPPRNSETELEQMMPAAISDAKVLVSQNTTIADNKQAHEQGSSLASVSSLQKQADDSAIRIKMLARIAVSDAHFKHQQRDDPDLTMEDKIEIAQKMLDENKVNFLSRFSQYLEIEDLKYFQSLRHIYEIDFYCKQVEKSQSGSFHRNRVKNRRYKAMKKLISEGEYFSEEEMKFREPYLYDQMIGQYLTDDEIQAQVDKSDLRFSSILIRHMDLLDENARFAKEKDKEEGQMEEEEEESEEEESELESDSEDKAAGCGGEEGEKRKTIPENERQELRQEFITIMQEKFLSGKDKNFDYSKVDNSEQYDDLNVLDMDAEEKYFDDEDSNSVHSVDAMET